MSNEPKAADSAPKEPDNLEFWQRWRDTPDALLTYSESQMKYEMLAWARPFERYR